MIDVFSPLHFVPPPVSPGTLGDVPRGFLEKAGYCEQTDTAFVRGILLKAADYDALDVEQRLALGNLPRWTLYGGPLSTKQLAETWDTHLFFWAGNTGYHWHSDGPVCIAPQTAGLKWPPNQSFQWTWVYETTRKKVVKVYNQAKGQNEWRWA